MKQGTKAVVSKGYFSLNRRFAEICNQGIFHGEHVLDADKLCEQDAVEQNVSGIWSEEVDVLWKERDILKKYADGASFLLIGVENQTEIHYCMPLRNLLYDTLNYEEQRRRIASKHLEKKDISGAEFLSGFAKTDLLNPVFTLVLYYGEKEWDAATSLSQLLNIPEELIQYKDKLLDYKINLLDVNRIENLDDYSDDLKALFGFLKYQKDKKALAAFVDENEHIYQNLSPESMQAIAVLGNFREVESVIRNEQNDGKRCVDMCRAIREMLEDARNEGREEGRKEAILLFVEFLVENGMEKSEIQKNLIQKFQISKEQAVNYYTLFVAG